MGRVGTNFWLKMGELWEFFSGKLILEVHEFSIFKQQKAINPRFEGVLQETLKSHGAQRV